MRHKSRFIALCFASIGLAAMMTAPPEAVAQSHYATSQAQNDYDEGINYERQAEQRGDPGYLEKALHSYRSAVKNDPNFVAAYARLGYVYYVLKKSEEGVKVLRDARQQHPDNIEIQHYLGLNLYQTGALDEAQELLWGVVSQTDKLPEAYFVLGKIALDNKDYGTAEGNFNQYVALAPKDAQGYRALSLVYAQQKNLDGAEASLKQLLALEPNDYAATITMGHVKFERGEIKEAVDYYEKAYKMDEKNVEVLYLMGSAYYLSGEYDSAIKAFERVLAKNSKHLGALYFTADAYLKSGKLDEAEASFKALYALMPNYHYLQLKLAYIKYLRGNKQEAEAEINSVLEKTDTLDDLNYGAILFRKMGKVEQARKIHEDLSNRYPNTSLFGIMLARDYLESRDYGTAIGLLSEVLEKDLNDQTAWELLSIAFLSQGYEAMISGDLGQARSSFDQASGLAIHPVESLCSLAQVSLLEGNVDEAQQMKTLAVEIDASHPKVELLTAHLELMDGDFMAAKARLEELSKKKDGALMGATGWYLLSVAQSWLGEWDNASASLSKAERLGARSSSATSVLQLQQAMTAYSQNKYDEGDELLSKSYAHRESLSESDGIRADYLTATSYIRHKKFTQARSLLEKVKKEFNKLNSFEREQIVANGVLDLDIELAYTYVETGALDQALKLINGKKGSEYQEVALRIRRKLGVNAFKGGQYQQALSHLEEVSSMGGNDTADQHNLVIVRYMTGKLKTPDSQLERFAKANIPDAVLNYAIYLDESGKHSESVKYYEKYTSSATGKRAEEAKKILNIKTRVWGPAGN